MKILERDLKSPLPRIKRRSTAHQEKPESVAFCRRLWSQEVAVLISRLIAKFDNVVN